MALLWWVPAFAQEDLLSILDEEEEQQVEQAYATFKTTRIVNGQSVETNAGGVLNFIIGHRFGKINDGPYQFFGLDESTIRLGLEYGISDRIGIGIGRSSFQKTFDGSVKIKALAQNTGGTPVTVVIFSGIALNSLRWSDPERDNYYSSRLSYFHQLLIGRKFSSALSVQLTPTLIHRNLVPTMEDHNDVYALGAGARLKLTNRISLNGEYYYVFPGYNRPGLFNSAAIGFDIETGGHIFQLHFTNSKGMVENYFIAETNGDLAKGDVYFGFNINRVFQIVKNK